MDLFEDPSAERREKDSGGRKKTLLWTRKGLQVGDIA